MSGLWAQETQACTPLHLQHDRHALDQLHLAPFCVIVHGVHACLLYVCAFTCGLACQRTCSINATPASCTAPSCALSRVGARSTNGSITSGTFFTILGCTRIMLVLAHVHVENRSRWKQQVQMMMAVAVAIILPYYECVAPPMCTHI